MASQGMRYDRRWSSVAILFQAQALTIVLILLAMLLARADIAGLLLVLALIAWAALESRSRLADLRASLSR